MIKAKSAAARRDPGGDVKHPVTDRFRGGSAELADAADALRPAEQVVRSEAEVHSDLVVDDVIEGPVGESAGFGVADDVLGACALALLQLECGDVVAGLGGDERGVTEPFDRVEQRQLRARMGTLTPDDQPGPIGPGRQVDELGEFDDFGAVTTSAAGVDGVDGGVPAAGRDHHDAVADAVVDVEPERVVEVACSAFLSEPM